MDTSYTYLCRKIQDQFVSSYTHPRSSSIEWMWEGIYFWSGISWSARTWGNKKPAPSKISSLCSTPTLDHKFTMVYIHFFHLHIQPTLVSVIRQRKIVYAAAGVCHSIFIDSHGSVYTCGKGKGLLGHGDTRIRTVPSKVEGLEVG